MTNGLSPRASLRCFRDRRLLFDEASQEIYEVDELTAYVWQSMQSGISLKQAAKDLVAAGVSVGAAKLAVAQAQSQLRTISEHVPNSVWTKIPVPTASVEGPNHCNLRPLTIEFRDVAAVELRLSKDLWPEVLAVLGHLRTARCDSDFRITAATSGQKVRIHSADGTLWHCERAEFAASLKADILAQVLRLADYEVALHAAALSRGRRAILLSGQPGAGKSTLALALARAGWELAADDVVLVHRDGSSNGLAFPITAKASSWPLVDEFWPDLARLPFYRRPDGLDVRYIIPDRMAEHSFEIAAFVSLDRRPDAVATLEDLEPVSMLGLLLAEGASRDQRLTLSGFNALATALEISRCLKLTYCDLSDGVTSLDRLA